MAISLGIVLACFPSAALAACVKCTQIRAILNTNKIRLINFKKFELEIKQDEKRKIKTLALLEGNIAAAVASTSSLSSTMESVRQWRVAFVKERSEKINKIEITAKKTTGAREEFAVLDAS